jgi:hypothetical protein
VRGGWAAAGGEGDAASDAVVVVMVASLVCVASVLTGEEGAVALVHTADGEGERGADTDAGGGGRGTDGPVVVAGAVVDKGGRVRNELRKAALRPATAASTGAADMAGRSRGARGAVARSLAAASVLYPLRTCLR